METINIDVVAVGDSCGKTPLLYAMQQTDFKLENVPGLLRCAPTVIDSYQVKNLNFYGVDITVNLYDTAGQVKNFKCTCQNL